MRRVISYYVLILCLEFVASFPYPEEYLEAYQSNNPSLGGRIPRQIQVSNLAHTQNGPSNPTYQEFINRDANTVLQPTRYNNIRYETRPSFERPVQYSHVEYPSNTNTATPSAIQDIINRETIAQQRQNYENLIRSQQQIHEQFANQMRVQNLPQIQSQYPSREPLFNTVSEPYINAVSTSNPYQQNIGNDNISPAVPQYYHVQQQLPLNSPAQRPFAENTAQSGQNVPTQIEMNHDVPTSPLNKQIQQSYNQWPNKQIHNVPGYNMDNLFAKHPYIKDLLSTTTQRKRYMVIHPNGTIEHVDTLEPVAERHPNYLLVNAASLPQNYGHWTGRYPQPQAPPAASSSISTSPNSNNYANPYQQIAPTQTTQLTPESSAIYTAPEPYPTQHAPTNPQAPAAPETPETSSPISATQVSAPQPTFPAPQPTIPAPASASVEPEVVTTKATLAKPDTSAPTDPTKPTVPSNSVLGPKPAIPVFSDATSPADLLKAAEPAIQVTPPSPGPKVTPTPSKTVASPITHLKPAIPANPDTKSKLNVPETSAVPSKTSEPAKVDRPIAIPTPSKIDTSVQPTTQAITATDSGQTKNIKQSVPVTAAKKAASVQPKSNPANTTTPDSPKSVNTPAKPDNLTIPTPTKKAPETSTTPDKRAGSRTPTSPAKPANSKTPTIPSKPADSTAPTSPASPATSTTPEKPADSTISTIPSKPADVSTPTIPSKPANSTGPTSPASPATSTTPAKPASLENPVTAAKKKTPKTNKTPPKPKSTTPDKQAASKTPAKPNGPTTSTTPAKPHSSGTPTSPVSPKKTTSLPQASTTPSTAVGKADSPSNKTSVKTSASSTEIAEPHNDALMAEKLNPLGVDFSKVKSTSKPVMWFRTSDLDVMSKLTTDDQFNVIYFIQVPPQPKIEKDIIKTVFPNGTIVEEITETFWDNEEDEEPRVTKTVRVLNQKN